MQASWRWLSRCSRHFGSRSPPSGYASARAIIPGTPCWSQPTPAASWPPSETRRSRVLRAGQRRHPLSERLGRGAGRRRQQVVVEGPRDRLAGHSGGPHRTPNSVALKEAARLGQRPAWRQRAAVAPRHHRQRQPQQRLGPPAAALRCARLPQELGLRVPQRCGWAAAVVCGAWLRPGVSASRFAGHGGAGQGMAGQGRAWRGRAGQDRALQGRVGQGGRSGAASARVWRPLAAHHSCRVDIKLYLDAGCSPRQPWSLRQPRGRRCRP
ncbi:MAG: hypothetical protein J3K34DRAFT_445946 [Monoraphidium minutum]|nr:MAG: hypothetical protein J3K34DRAFT_445946 [Monoraphidium minutum]